MPETLTLYTVGHSKRRLQEFLAPLREAGIEVLADVRARPASRRHPWFNRDALEQALTEAGIAYRWLGRELGGLREASPGSPHLALDAAFRGYAEHMATPAFQAGMTELLKLGGRQKLVLLCAEKEPEHCHRSLIADWLTAQGVQVIHLIEPGLSRAHVLSPVLRLEKGRLIYDRHTQAGLF
jgi:uncharacterized protein (DUF488 family)